MADKEYKLNIAAISSYQRVHFLNDTDLAKRIGISASHYSLIKTGKKVIKIPTARKIKKYNSNFLTI